MHYEKASIFTPFAIAIQLTLHSILQDCFILLYMIARYERRKKESRYERRDKNNVYCFSFSSLQFEQKRVEFGVFLNSPVNQAFTEYE